MLTRSVAANGQTLIISTAKASVQPGRPLLISLILPVLLFSTLLVYGVVTTTSAQMIIGPSDLPQTLLPGSPPPADTLCYKYSGERDPRCSVHFLGREVYFNFDADRKLIVRTLVPSREYTIGQLVAAWGTPTGITRNEAMVYVHWDGRSALLYTKTFRPETQTELILYDLEPLPASTWRGFGLFE